MPTQHWFTGVFARQNSYCERSIEGIACSGRIDGGYLVRWNCPARSVSQRQIATSCAQTSE